MLTRTMTVNNVSYQVPKFIHRSFANGGGWRIGVPGVKYELSDADNFGTANALELIKEQFAEFMKFDPEFMIRICDLDFVVGETGAVDITIRSGDYVCTFATITPYGVPITPIIKHGFNSPEFRKFITIETWSLIVHKWAEFAKAYVQTPGGFDFNRQTRHAGTITRFVPKRA